RATRREHSKAPSATIATPTACRICRSEPAILIAGNLEKLHCSADILFAVKPFERVGRALSATPASCVHEISMADNVRPTRLQERACSRPALRLDHALRPVACRLVPAAVGRAPPGNKCHVLRMLFRRTVSAPGMIGDQ